MDQVYNFIKDSLEGDNSLITVCSTADKYTFIVNEKLKELLQPGGSISDRDTLNKVRETKLSILRHKLEEDTGIDYETLKIVWCYFNLQGATKEVSIKSLINKIKEQTDIEVDSISLIGKLKNLEQFTEEKFSLDLITEIAKEVKQKAQFSPKEYRRFLTAVYTSVASKGQFQGLEIKEDGIRHIVETYIGLNETDYAVYKACHDLNKINETKEKIVPKHALLKQLSDNGFKLNLNQINNSLSKIQQIFDETFVPVEVNKEQTPITLKMLPQEARRRLGVELVGHYKDIE